MARRQRHAIRSVQERHLNLVLVGCEGCEIGAIARRHGRRWNNGDAMSGHPMGEWDSKPSVALSPRVGGAREVCAGPVVVTANVGKRPRRLGSRVRFDRDWMIEYFRSTC